MYFHDRKYVYKQATSQIIQMMGDIFWNKSTISITCEDIQRKKSLKKNETTTKNNNKIKNLHGIT